MLLLCTAWKKQSNLCAAPNLSLGCLWWELLEHDTLRYSITGLPNHSFWRISRSFNDFVKNFSAISTLIPYLTKERKSKILKNLTCDRLQYPSVEQLILLKVHWKKLSIKFMLVPL